jgi:hypothetical protein
VFPPQIPSDKDHYFRRPSPNCRLYAYESLLAVIYANFSEQSLAERGEDWRQAIRDRAVRQQKSLEAYFRWILSERFGGRLAPDEMILSVLIIPSPKPGESDRPAPFEVPLARWRAAEASKPGRLPFDVYDPVAKEFIPVLVPEGGP